MSEAIRNAISKTIFTNAKVITLDPLRPSADTVVVEGHRISWVGMRSDASLDTSAYDRVVDCQGGTLIPGFVDSHAHVFAAASRLTEVDCRSPSVNSISDLLRKVSDLVNQKKPGEWIRAFGYDDLSLLENRHPTRLDLDQAAPNNPVRLMHRSGHAVVLNTLALQRVGITSQAPDPPYGVIERDHKTGEPNGILFEMDSFLEGRVPRLTTSEFNDSVKCFGSLMASYGVTSVHDATPSNSIERWQTFVSLMESDVLPFDVSVMPGFNHIDEFIGNALQTGSGNKRLNIGHAKIMLTTTTGHLYPSENDLLDMIRSAHLKGFSVAIHAVEHEAVMAAANTIRQAREHRPANLHSADRIEHASECPPDVIEALRLSGAAVSTNPAFLYERGDVYLENVSESMIPWLYPIRSFMGSGIEVAFGSDAPVGFANPLVGIASAIDRQSSSGRAVAANKSVSPIQALQMATLNGSKLIGQGEEKGIVKAGYIADVVLLDDAPTAVPHSQIRDIKVMLTMVGGKVVWEA